MPAVCTRTSGRDSRQAIIQSGTVTTAVMMRSTVLKQHVIQWVLSAFTCLLRLHRQRELLHARTGLRMPGCSDGVCCELVTAMDPVLFLVPRKWHQRQWDFFCQATARVLCAPPSAAAQLLFSFALHRSVVRPNRRSRCIEPRCGLHRDRHRSKL